MFQWDIQYRTQVLVGEVAIFELLQNAQFFLLRWALVEERLHHWAVKTMVKFYNLEWESIIKYKVVSWVWGWGWLSLEECLYHRAIIKNPKPANLQAGVD